VEAALRAGTTEVRIARRAQALLLMADGVSTYDTAKLIGVHVRTVFEWRERFRTAEDPSAKLADAPRSGRPPSLSLSRTLRG
jgi:transposase